MRNSKNKPLISVLVGVYNAQDTVRDSINSLLCQSYKNIEIIVVNDGSTDNTKVILDSITDSRVKVFHQDNQGLTKTLNKALGYSCGEYIARQDADDISLYNRLETQIERLLVDRNIKATGSSTYLTNQYGIINELYHYPQNYEQIKTAMSHYNPFVHGSMLIERKVLESVGGYDEEFRFVQDYDLWSRMYQDFEMVNIGQPLYVRFRGKNCSEITQDKSTYVHKIQEKIREYGSGEPDKNFVEIHAQSIYPIISKMTCLSQTYKLMKPYSSVKKTKAKYSFLSKLYAL
tara:strand:- start:1599 stop:2465 length:867 start_codon:yes stop_codon:yes gene_type:complete